MSVSGAIIDNRLEYQLKSKPHTVFIEDFETIRINAGDIIVKVVSGEIRAHRLSDMIDFTITPRNELVNNSIPWGPESEDSKIHRYREALTLLGELREE